MLACATMVVLTAGATLPGEDIERGGDPGGMRSEPTWLPIEPHPLDFPVHVLGELERRGAGATGERREPTISATSCTLSLATSVQAMGCSVTTELLPSVVSPALLTSRAPVAWQHVASPRTTWAPSALPQVAGLDGWWSWVTERPANSYWDGRLRPERALAATEEGTPGR